MAEETGINRDDLLELAAADGALPIDVQLALLEQLGEDGYERFRQDAWAQFRRRVAKAKRKRRQYFEDEGIDLLPAFNYPIPAGAPGYFLSFESVPKPQPDATVTGPLVNASGTDLEGVERKQPLLGPMAAKANAMMRRRRQ